MNCHPISKFVFLLLFFYPLFLWVFLVCFPCCALLHIQGHSPPPTCYYVSYMISPFVKTTQGHMTPTRECTHLTNRVTSQFKLVTILFQACEASRHIFSTLCGWETLKCISDTKNSWKARVKLRIFESVVQVANQVLTSVTISQQLGFEM